MSISYQRFVHLRVSNKNGGGNSEVSPTSYIAYDDDASARVVPGTKFAELGAGRLMTECCPHLESDDGPQLISKSWSEGPP